MSTARFKRIFSISGVRKVYIKKRTASNRVKKIVIVTPHGETSIDPVNFRHKLGQKNIKSYLFSIRLRGNKIQVAGRGYGHGVGLCQWGSRVMAEKNMNHRRILRHFFPNTSVSRFFHMEDLG